MSRPKRTIALDFDGVLHRYDGWQGGKIQGPIDGAREAVEKLLARGHEVVVFTTRDAQHVRQWLNKYDFPPLEITATKRPFYVLVDDRALRFDGQWGEEVVQAIEGFEPYWIKARKA